MDRWPSSKLGGNYPIAELNMSCLKSAGQIDRKIEIWRIFELHSAEKHTKTSSDHQIVALS